MVPGYYYIGVHSRNMCQIPIITCYDLEVWEMGNGRGISLYSSPQTLLWSQQNFNSCKGAWKIEAIIKQLPGPISFLCILWHSHMKNCNIQNTNQLLFCSKTEPKLIQLYICQESKTQTNERFFLP